VAERIGSGRANRKWRARTGIVMYSYNKNQRDALILKFIFDKGLYIFRTDLLSIIRSLNTVNTEIGIRNARSGWNSSSILTSLADSQHNLHDKYIFLFILVINQLDAQIFFCFAISLFHASTCFEHMCSKHVEA